MQSHVTIVKIGGNIIDDKDDKLVFIPAKHLQHMSRAIKY